MHALDHIRQRWTRPILVNQDLSIQDFKIQGYSRRGGQSVSHQLKYGLIFVRYYKNYILAVNGFSSWIGYGSMLYVLGQTQHKNKG